MTRFWAPAPPARPCPACGEPGEPSDRYCCGCGREFEPGRERPVLGELRRLPCSQCGAALLLDASRRAVDCPFCETPFVHEPDAGDLGRPDPELVIPFALGEAEARRALRDWLGGARWYHPGDLAARAREQKLLGVYLPFWVFGFTARSRWTASIGEHWYREEEHWVPDEKGNLEPRKQRIREVEWVPLKGAHHQDYVGETVSASLGLPVERARRIEPFRVEGLRPYDPAFLAGWASEEARMSRAEAAGRARRRLEQEERARVKAFLPGDTQRGLRVRTQLEEVSGALALAPVYLIAYRYGGKLYHFMVNGQTGRISGDRPVSWRRVALALAAGLLLAALLIWRKQGGAA